MYLLSAEMSQLKTEDDSFDCSNAEQRRKAHFISGPLLLEAVPGQERRPVAICSFIPNYLQDHLERDPPPHEEASLLATPTTTKGEADSYSACPSFPQPPFLLRSVWSVIHYSVGEKGSRLTLGGRGGASRQGFQTPQS